MSRMVCEVLFCPQMRCVYGDAFIVLTTIVYLYTMLQVEDRAYRFPLVLHFHNMWHATCTTCGMLHIV